MKPDSDRNTIILAAADAFFRNSEELFFLKDTNLTYVHASKMFAQLTGHSSPDAILGKTDFDLFEHDLAQKYVDDDRRMLETGESLPPYTEPMPPVNGKPRYSSTCKKLIRDASGTVIGIYGTGRDITREHEARMLYERERAFLFTFSPETLAVILFDLTSWSIADSKFRDGITSRDFRTIAEYQHYTADSVLGDEDVRQFILSLSPQSLREMYENGRRLFSLEYLSKNIRTAPSWVRVESRFLVEPDSGHLMAGVLLLDIDAEKRERAQLVRAAEQDAMTGILNHEATLRHITRFLENEGAKGRHALFMIDIDNFKTVNDTLGHIMGDTIIKDIASAIHCFFRRTDLIGRIGGDEFLVLMKSISDMDLGQKAHELIDALQYVYNRDDITLHLSGSVGISVYDGNGKPLKQLYAEADSALYRAKAAGKNRYEIAVDSPCTQEPGASLGGISTSVHLRTLLDNMDAAMLLCEVSDDIHFVYASPSTFSSMACPPTLLGENAEHLFSIVLSEDLPAFRQAILDTAASGAAMEHSYRVLVPSRGETAWQHARGVRLPEAENGVHRLLIISTDITNFKQTEEQLRFAELRYRTAVEQSDIMLWETDFRFGTLRHTGSLAEDLGIANCTFRNPPESLLKEKCIRPENESLLRKMYADILAGRDSQDYVFVVTNTRGQEYPIKMHFRILRDKQGIPFFAVGTAERLLQDSRELALYRTMTFSGVFTVRIDEDFTLLYGNDRYYALHEYTREELRERLGNRCREYVHPDDRATVSASVQQALASEQRSLLLVMRVITGAGNIKYIQTSGELQRQHDGTCVMNGVVIDVTAQKELELALKTEKLKMDAVLSGTNILLWEHDLATHRTRLPKKAQQALNLPEILEDTPNAALSKGIILPDSADAYRELYRKLEAGKKEVSADLHFAAVYGREAWMRCTLRAFSLSDKQPTLCIGFALNVSDIKTSENRYASLLRERESIDKDAIGSFWFNLSTNRCWGGHAINDSIMALQASGTIDGFFAYGYTQNTNSQLLAEFEKQFNRQNLLRSFREGKNVLSFEHRYRIAPDRDEWIRTVIHMMRNPQNGDVEALIYARNIHAEKTSRALVERLVDIEYECIALIDAQTGRFTIVSRTGAQTPTLANNACYPEDAAEFFRQLVLERDIPSCLEKLSLPAIIAALDTSETYIRTYSTRTDSTGKEPGSIRRKKWQFTYLDETKRAIVYTRSDVTDSYLSEIDPVTGIYNNAKFRVETRHLLDAHPQTPFVMARFDIDNFKIFNDFYGIETGNRLLSSIGELFRSRKLPQMTYGHVEADHFIFCVPESDLGLVPPLSDIVECLRKQHPEFDFSLRMGIYRIDDPSLEIALMNDRAYLALRSIKRHYDRHVAYYDESMRRTLLHYQTIAGEMRDAFSSGQFGIYLQPQYNMDTGKLIGAEALVRWFHPVRGIVPPDLFIPVFENNGFITQIDKYVWELACKLLRKWLDNGIEVVPLSVNVSRIDIYDPAICDTLVGLVTKYRLAPELLRLEITETAYMENPKQLISVIEALHTKGFAIEMDDFGSGYSSLNLLKDVHVDTLKLDMHFLTESGDRTRGGNILSSIIRMARWIDLPVIAEGVETQEQADYLKSIGCLLMQGYFFARPMPTEEFEKLLTGKSIGAFKRNGRTFPEKLAQFWDASTQSALIFNSFMGGAAILEYGNGTIEGLRMNDRFFELLGTTRDAYQSWMLHIQDRFVGESREAYIHMLETAARTGEEAFCEIASVPLEPNGEKIWTRNRAILLYHAESSDIFYVSVDNISDRKRLEEENRVLSEHILSVLKGLSCGLETLEPVEGLRLIYSGKTLCRLGYDHERFTKDFANTPNAAIPSEDITKIRQLAENARRSGIKIISVRFRHRCRDGRWLDVQGTGNALFFSQQSPQLTLVVEAPTSLPSC